MKLLLLSDVHLSISNPESRLDDMLETQWTKLRFIFDYAWENNCTILQAGDLSTTPRSWVLLSKLTKFLKSYKGVPVYTVFGQHDTYLYSEEKRHTVITGILERAGLVTVLGEKRNMIDGGTVAVYGASYGEDSPDPKDNKAFNILVVHDSISDKKLPHSTKNALKYLKTRPAYNLILCGDIHRIFNIRTDLGRIILNSGSMLRREATTYNMARNVGFYLFNTKTGSLKFVEIPHLGGKRVLTRAKIETREAHKKSLENLSIELADEEETQEYDPTKFDENLLAYFEEHDTDERVRAIFDELREATDGE